MLTPPKTHQQQKLCQEAINICTHTHTHSAGDLKLKTEERKIPPFSTAQKSNRGKT